MYKLTYFDVPARAETTRWLFALAEQPYEDIRIKHKDWDELKPKTPFGQLPTLEVDGHTVCQSSAINNFLAKRFGYAGKDEMAQLRMDMVVGCIEDMVMQIVRPIVYSPPETKAAHRKGAQPKLDAFFDRLEALLVSNNGGDGYFVGDSLTLADLVFVVRSIFPYGAHLRVNWSKLPKLAALKKSVLAVPQIAAWRKKQPVETSFRLTYFDTAGRAELARLIFAAAGQTYADIRLTGDEWAEIKPNTSFGQMPLLDVDDTTISQSIAIARYLANRFGFAGTTSMDMARTDMVIDCLADFYKDPTKMFLSKDPVEQAKLHKLICEEQAPVFLKRMSVLVAENTGGKGHFAGSEMTWADLAFYQCSVMMSLLKIPVVWSEYPDLQAVIQNVQTNPRIAEYIAKRPSPVPKKYVLSYFNMQGRGEVPRILATIAKLNFEDRRIDGDDWPKVKLETPMGGLPTLEFDGETYCQSTAICRYLAKKAGMEGKGDEACMKVDMLADSMVDYLQDFRGPFYEKDPERKATMNKAFLEEKSPATLGRLEALLTKNNGGDGFFVGDDMTWCDIFFMNAMEVMTGAGLDIKLANYPKLQQLLQAVQKDKRVLAWTQKRPQ